MNEPKSRYAVVSRRALLKGGAGLGAVALFPGLACGTDDAAVLAGARTSQGQALATTEPVGIDPAAAAAPSAPAAPSPVPEAQVEAAPTQPAAAPTPVPATTALATGTQAVIDFTYSQAPGGKNLPPYLAVWIEDASGELVATIALWYQQRRGDRWLPDLRRWYSVDQQRIDLGGAPEVDVISSATRLAGSFSVVWDGTGRNGQAADAGEHFVCIESARERGPYSLIREAVLLNGRPFDVSLSDEGELIDARAMARV